MRKSLNVVMTLAILISMGFAIDYQRIAKSMQITSCQASNILTVIYRYKNKIPILETSQKTILNNLLQRVRNSDDFGYYYDNYILLTTEIATNFENMKKDLKMILTDRQIKETKIYFSRIFSKRVLDFSILSSSVNAYLGLADLSTDTEAFTQAFAAIKMNKSEALKIRNILFRMEPKIKNVNFLISSLKSDYDSALKAGVNEKTIKNKLTKVKEEKSELLANIKSSLIDILTQERYENFIKTYKHMFYQKRVERIIFDNNFIETLKNIEKSK